MRRWHLYCYLLSIDVCARFRLCGQNNKPVAIGQGGNKQKIYNNQPTGGAVKNKKESRYSQHHWKLGGEMLFVDCHVVVDVEI